MQKNPVFEYVSKTPTTLTKKGHEISKKGVILYTPFYDDYLYQFGDGITKWKDVESQPQVLSSFKFATFYHRPAVDYAVLDFCLENNISGCDYISLKAYVYENLLVLCRDHGLRHMYYNDYKKVASEEYQKFLEKSLENRCSCCSGCKDNGKEHLIVTEESIVTS